MGSFHVVLSVLYFSFHLGCVNAQKNQVYDAKFAQKNLSQINVDILDSNSNYSSGTVEFPNDHLTDLYDRVYKYESGFDVEKPFGIKLKGGESIMIPIGPIEITLFPTEKQTKDPVAIGFQLNSCGAHVASRILMKNSRVIPFSSSRHQCMTLSKDLPVDDTVDLNLCPFYHPDRPIALRIDPKEVQGVILTADVGLHTQAFALFRSSKSAGPLKKSFVGDYRVKIPFNLTYAGEDSTMSFDPPTIREKVQTSTDQNSVEYQERPCADCEYVLYGRKLSKHEIDQPVTKPLPALCIAEMSSIQMKIPSYSLETDQISLASLPSHIDSTGVYEFTLMARLAHDNNDHIARMAYGSHCLPVEASSHAGLHFFIAFVGVAALGGIGLFAVRKYESHKRRPKPEEAKSLLCLSDPLDMHEEEQKDEHTQEEKRMEMYSAVERKSLLDVIKESKMRDQQSNNLDSKSDYEIIV